MAESIAAQKVDAAKAALDAKNKALAGKFMAQEYDWVETAVQRDWLPNAAVGKVVGSVLASMNTDAPVEAMVNVLRRAYHAHENRPILDWQPFTQYRLGDRVQDDGKVYRVDSAGSSGELFGDTKGTVVFTLEDPQPVSAKKIAAPVRGGSRIAPGADQYASEK